jgi:hypothetical protein
MEESKAYRLDITMIDEQLLEKAFIEVRKSSLHHCAHASIWDLSHHWRTLKPQILKNTSNGYLPI